MGKSYHYSYKCFPYLLNIYNGLLIHLYFDGENCMGIEYKSILLKSIFTQTNQLVVIFITKHFFITWKYFDTSANNF